MCYNTLPDILHVDDFDELPDVDEKYVCLGMHIGVL